MIKVTKVDDELKVSLIELPFVDQFRIQKIKRIQTQACNWKSQEQSRKYSKHYPPPSDAQHMQELGTQQIVSHLFPPWALLGDELDKQIMLWFDGVRLEPRLTRSVKAIIAPSPKSILVADSSLGIWASLIVGRSLPTRISTWQPSSKTKRLKTCVCSSSGPHTSSIRTNAVFQQWLTMIHLLARSQSTQNVMLQEARSMSRYQGAMSERRFFQGG